MRILLNILAVIIGLVSGLVAVSCCVIDIVGVVAYFRGSPSELGIASGILAFIFVAGVAFLGFLIASRALLHLRHPDAGTARDMIGTAIYLILMAGVLPLGLRLQAPGFPLLAVVVGLYVFHRWLVKRIVARAYPPETIKSHA